MPDQKLSQLQSATTPLAGTELVYVVQGGNSRKTTVNDIAPGTDLTYTAATRTLASSTGDDVVLPLATDSLDGLMSAAQRLLTQALIDAGVSATGSVVSIPHIHGDLAGAVYIHVKNTSGGQLVKGTPVRVTGTVGDTTTLEVAAADATSQATMPAIGILDATLAQNGTGHAVVAGELTGLATNGYTIGDPLYVAIGGGLTATRPTTGLVQQVAIVGRVNASTGSVTVTIGSEMDPPHSAVTLAASVADILNLSGQELQADDPGGDRLLFWDDSEGKLTHAAVGPGLQFDGTTLRVEEWLWVACSDETTALTIGNAKITFRMPFAATLLSVRASVNTAPVGANLVVDINEAGTTLLSTKLSIDATEKTSTTAATAAVISDSSLADDAEITIDIDQVGSSTAGTGLKVGLYVRRV
jgi:hypothetical protein